jgi:hypothetical protein
MACIVDQAATAHLPFRKEGLWHKFSRVFRRKKRASGRRLDPRELSDYMKRDLGFLDGRG